ncbi:J domain-containing protein [Caenispirillum bisanense]|uniref:DnaJ domain-containing protein n=1 Tax=Caenispirillum bisanense TaxID=414052 RepID=A0A286GQ88_9PROT|nr:J domain-containing protein [Caenispirillum bisanense]SOD97144.1 DnaJ domain-containing protein [Caenispirillum bisanense]
MRDPYSVLGVSHTATQDDVKKAFRRLARTMHPDLHPDDAQAADRFKEINAAYGILGDADKRAKFDRGEIDAAGNPRAPFGFGGGRGGRAGGPGGRGRPGAGGRTGGPFGFDFDSTFADDDLFNEIFTRASKAKADAQAKSQPKGPDSHYRLKVSFREAALGATRRIRLTNGKTLDVRIPPRSEDGRTLRLKGQGLSAISGGPAGDALVEISIKDTDVWKREGDDVIAEVPVTLKEAVLGGKITVPTLTGKVAVTVPEGANSGTVLRLRGKGLPKEGDEGGHGDYLVRLRIVLPDPKDAALKDFCDRWNPAGDEDLRKKLFEEE